MIYAYMRVSTSQQTLENQHYALLKFADQRAWHIDQWITETGSGATPTTERLLGSLLDQLRAQDILLVTELSRLGRRLMEIMQLLARLLEKRVTVICIKEGLEVGDTLNAKVLAFAFGLEVIAQFAATYLARLEQYLGDTTLGSGPLSCQAASSRADSEAVSDTGGAGAVVTRCPRLSHCWASQPLQS